MRSDELREGVKEIEFLTKPTTGDVRVGLGLNRQLDRQDLDRRSLDAEPQH